MNEDAVSREREFCKRLAAHDLTTKEELLTAIVAIIESATSSQQLREIGNAIITAVLVSNPDLFRQLPNGKWVLRAKRDGTVVPLR